MSITEPIRITLEKNNIQHTKDEDSFNFKHPACPNLVDCIITWEESRKQVQFVADFEVKMPPELSEEALAAMLNDLNYDSSWGNLETDGNGLLVYRLSTFLPDGRDAAVAICSKALTYFLNASIFQLKKVETRLKQIREERRGRDMCHSMTESLRSGVIELECLHHRVMQLAEAANTLFDEFQVVCSDDMTQAQLSIAGRDRIRRDVRVIRQEEERLHADICDFAARYHLPLNIQDVPGGWTMPRIQQDFALTGFLNTAITDLFLALCRRDDHAA